MKKLFLGMVLMMTAGAAKGQNIPAYKVQDLVNRISGTDTVYVVNFWATWCGPCVKELPEFNRLADGYANRPVKVILVSLDFPKDYPNKVRSFAKKKKLAHELVWLNETDANYFIPKIDDRWQGSIPATLIQYNQAGYKNFFEGSITAKQLGVLIDKQLALSGN